MAAVIHITPEQPVVVELAAGAGTDRQIAPLHEPVDVLAYRWLDLELVVVRADLSEGASVSIGVATGMQAGTEDGWINSKVSTAATATQYDFDAITTSTAGNPPILRRTAIGRVGKDEPPAILLRYVRWVAQLTAGSTASLAFYVRGVARTLGR